MEMVVMSLGLLRRLLPRLGPYAVVEIVLPGGTLIALLLYLYRRRVEDRPMLAPIRRG